MFHVGRIISITCLSLHVVIILIFVVLILIRLYASVTRLPSNLFISVVPAICPCIVISVLLNISYSLGESVRRPQLEASTPYAYQVQHGINVDRVLCRCGKTPSGLHIPFINSTVLDNETACSPSSHCNGMSLEHCKEAAHHVIVRKKCGGNHALLSCHLLELGDMLSQLTEPLLCSFLRRGKSPYLGKNNNMA